MLNLTTVAFSADDYTVYATTQWWLKSCYPPLAFLNLLQLQHLCFGYTIMYVYIFVCQNMTTMSSTVTYLQYRAHSEMENTSSVAV